MEIEAELYHNQREEILQIVITALPLKSLARFMCLSKYWHSVISDYVKNVQPKRPQHKVLAFYNDWGNGYALDSVDDACSVERIPRPRPWKKQGNLQIFGSCNGLLLIGFDEDLFLWNPLSGLCKKVLSYFRLNDCFAKYGVASGLCYDSSADEYKAVMALSHQTPSYGTPSYGESFMVVGSFRNKTWTTLDFPLEDRSINFGPVVNGNLHCFVSKEDGPGHFLSAHQIVYFDPHKNEFKDLAMPQPKDGNGDIIVGLGVLGRCLCMVRRDNPSDYEGDLEVLAMNEYGKGKSWTLMFTVSNPTTGFRHHDDVLVPLCSAKNGEVLVNRGHQIEAYNPIHNSQRVITNLTQKCYYLGAIMYEESLVAPPADCTWEEDEKRGETMYLEYWNLNASGSSLFIPRITVFQRWTRR